MSPNIIEPRAFRSKLDDELIVTLAPLLIHKAVVCFPFFANTFPLVFHYFCLLRSANISANLTDRRIKLISWGDERRLIKYKRSQTPLVVYSTEKDIGNAEGITKVHVTKFLPKYIFSEFNLRLWNASHRTIEADETTQPDIRKVVAALHKENSFEYFEVFTEIPAQAKALAGELFESLDLKEGTHYNVFDLTKATRFFDESHLLKKTLRLFLYGAPLTRYFLRKKQRYIPFEVTINGAEDSFETVVAVKGNPSVREAISNAICIYHRTLYDAAKKEKEREQQSFRAVQYHYNRVARLLQHRSSFPSSLEYAKCLADHHQPPKVGGQPNEPKGEER